MASVEADGAGVRLRVRVQPRASRTAVMIDGAGVIRIWLTAPPVDGAANALLEKAIAEALGVPRRQVRLASGEKSRDKVVSVSGIGCAEVFRRLPREPIRGSGD